MRGTVVCALAVVALLAALTASAPQLKYSETIDGHTTTIALASAHQIMGFVPETVVGLLGAIIDALTQEELDYWGEVEAEVVTMVGDYINAYNMAQVKIYQEDLVSLMERYLSAPVESDNYPDKNQQASALSTSIITHRYLLEAAVYPESMILHFQDISSIHALVLKDAAETYSFPDLPPSRWWVDLSQELDHYLKYGHALKDSLRTGRLSLVTCQIESKGDYDTFTARDAVTGEESRCVQLEGTGTCEDHCDLFYEHKSREVDLFTSSKVTDVLTAWQTLKDLADQYAIDASRYYDPLRSR